MNQIPNVFGSLEIGIWLLIVICYLVLGIFLIKGLNNTDIPKTTYLTYYRGSTLGDYVGESICLNFTVKVVPLFISLSTSRWES